MKILPPAISLDDVLKFIAKLGIKQSSRPHLSDTSLDDDAFAAIHPFRTKTDRNIRRLRWPDIVPYVSEDMAALMVDVFLDYIHTCNLYLYMLVHPYGYSVLHALKYAGAMDSLDSWIDATTKLNSFAKTGNLPIDVLMLVAEMQNLTGYRNPPIAGFDPLLETAKLAAAGTERVDGWNALFVSSLTKLLPRSVDYIRWSTFGESLSSFATSGSSGLSAYYNGEALPLRKNMLPFFYPIAYFEDKQPYPKQHSKAFVKPELAKCRIAVTGDFDTYALQSYLLSFVNHAYTEIPGISLEEKTDEEILRYERMVERLQSMNFCLPFDYAAFDHQPTMFEIKTIVYHLLRLGLFNVPEIYKPQFSDWIDTCVASFDHATVSMLRETYVVKGGVQSGIRLTSILGNIWNRVVMDIVEGVNPVDMIEVRGDDSNLVHSNWYKLVAIRLRLASYNIEGSDSKFSIHQQKTEFLRNWYHPDGLFGIPNRVIPGLMQSKPWSNSPWSAEAVVESLASTYHTLKRRVSTPIDQIKWMICRAWKKRRNVSPNYLFLPKHYGGLGLFVFDGKMPNRPVVFPSGPKLEGVPQPPRNVNPRWFGILARHKLDGMIPTSPEVLSEITRNEFAGILTTDDIRSYAKKARDLYNRDFDLWRIKNSKVLWTQVCAEAHSDYPTELELFGTYRTSYDHVLSQLPSFWGKYSMYLPLWQALQELKKYVSVRPMDILSSICPQFVLSIRDLERRYKLHRSTVIDILCQKKFPVRSPDLHPLSVAIHDALSFLLWLRWIQYKPPGRCPLSWMLAARSASVHLTSVGWYRSILSHW
jgi:hypothetical protein